MRIALSVSAAVILMAAIVTLVLINDKSLGILFAIIAVVLCRILMVDIPRRLKDHSR